MYSKKLLLIAVIVGLLSSDFTVRTAEGGVSGRDRAGRYWNDGRKAFGVSWEPQISSDVKFKFFPFGSKGRWKRFGKKQQEKFRNEFGQNGLEAFAFMIDRKSKVLSKSMGFDKIAAKASKSSIAEGLEKIRASEGGNELISKWTDGEL